MDEEDLVFLATYFDQASSGNPGDGNTRADLTRDGSVDLFDLVAVASNWHQGLLFPRDRNKTLSCLSGWLDPWAFLGHCWRA